MNKTPLEKIYVDDPNRLDGKSSFSVQQVISNYVSKIPGYNVKFQGNSFILSTSFTIKPISFQENEIRVTNEFDAIVKQIIEEIKNYKFSPKIERIAVNIDSGSGNMNVLYCTASASYTLE